MTQKIPQNFKTAFWDVDFENLHVLKSKTFIIERLINKGGLTAAKWLFKTYSKEEITSVILEHYNISTKALNLWAELLNIQKEKCRCMMRPLALRVFD